MSKITTEDCKKFLGKEFPEYNKNKWKRLKKYKSYSGTWIREFENGDIKATVEEKEGVLALFDNELKNDSKGKNFSFVIYKQDGDLDWSVFVSKNGEYEDDDDFADEVLEFVDENCSYLQVLESPNFNCNKEDVLSAYDNLVGLGLKFEKNLVNDFYEVFDRKEFIKNTDMNSLKNIKRIKTSYDLFVYVSLEARRALTDDQKMRVQEVVRELPDIELKNILNMNHLFADLDMNSFCMKQVIKETQERQSNPDRSIQSLPEDMSSIIRSKLGLGGRSKK